MIRKLIQGFNRYLFYLTIVPLVVATLVTIIDVIGRYTGHPLRGALEINQLSLVLICAWCWAHTQAKKGHIIIDLLYERMSTGIRNVANLFNAFMALAISGLLTWQSAKIAIDSQSLMEWTDILQIPMWPFKAMIALGGLALCLQLAIDIVEYFNVLRSRSHGHSA
ncbi:MAG: TRAP transporter small permease [Dehalococcoidales bacterium]|nr:TRAP transporter small permease [Dehalococcoidales bacterium]